MTATDPTTPDRTGAGAAGRLYAFLSGDDDLERSCAAIPEGDCTALPRNYLLNVANGACTKLAEQLASPGLVLPWLLQAIAAPGWTAGLLVPLKQAGSLVPQLAVAGYIRAVARRKWLWMAAAVVQSACLGAMAAAALWLSPTAAALVVLGLLALFSMASGVGSVAFQDVTAKTVPKGRRGGMLGNRQTIGAILTLAAAVWMRQELGEETAVWPYALLIGVAAGLWAMAAFCFAAIEEAPGSTRGGRNPLSQVGDGLRLFREQPGFRRYLIARTGLLAIELAMPFYALHAAGLFGGAAATLGLLVVAAAVATILSSPFWGRVSDTSARRTMVLSGLIAASAGAAALGLALLVPSGNDAGWPAWLYVLPIGLLSIAEGGVRLGRKTYMADAAPADDRPLYNAFANTTTGLAALAGSGLGGLAVLIGTDAMIAVLAGAGLLAALLAWRMPEAGSMVAAADTADPSGA